MRTPALLLGMVLPLTGAGAEVDLLPGSPVAVFGGGLRAVELVLRNRAQSTLQLFFDVQLFQASSSTVAPWSNPRPWRAVPFGPGQTVLERLEMDFPKVREESPFLVRLLHGREIVGVLEVRVYPSGILTSLTNGLGPVTVNSVTSELRQVLAEAGFRLVDRGQLSESGARTRLAIYGSGFARDADPLWAEALSQARTGLGVIWIESADAEKSRTAPSYYPVRVGQGVFVTVLEQTLTRLLTDPLAQLRLARIVRLALGQETLNPPESDL